LDEPVQSDSQELADSGEDWLPFNPAKTPLVTLLKFGRQYRNDEPRLAKVMLAIRERDFSAHREQVQALQWRWEYLVRTAQPPRWPECAAEKEERAFYGTCFNCGEQGMLAFFGYHVGETRGLIRAVRESILDYIYKGRLPVVNDEAYTRSWGDPMSPQRLRKLCTTIAYLARNAIARHNPNLHTAISEWEADLVYLRRMYFRPYDDPEHDWDWPVVGAY
jgi:hypothetical protein